MGVLDGRIAVVTGAARGLGRSHAAALAAAGARLLVSDVDAEALADASADAFDTTDLCSVDAGAALVERAVEHFGRIDILVNNAGISRSAPVTEIDDALLDAHLGVHLKATVGAMGAALRHMQPGGSIINTVSGAGIDPKYPNTGAYGAAKAAVWAVTQIAALEAKAKGIRVNAISPIARTRMSERFLQGQEGDFDPAKVSQVVVFLASDLAHDITGQVVKVGGPEPSSIEEVMRARLRT